PPMVTPVIFKVKRRSLNYISPFNYAGVGIVIRFRRARRRRVPCFRGPWNFSVFRGKRSGRYQTGEYGSVRAFVRPPSPACPLNGLVAETFRSDEVRASGLSDVERSSLAFSPQLEVQKDALTLHGVDVDRAAGGAQSLIITQIKTRPGTRAAPQQRGKVTYVK